MAMNGYLVKAHPTLIDVPIFIVECRHPRAETVWSFRTPLGGDLSRNCPGPRNEIQQTLLNIANVLDVDIDDHKQKQILCATAIGTKVRFWKKAQVFPQLYSWGSLLPLDLRKMEHEGAAEDKLLDVAEEGWAWAQEMTEINAF
jgi:hypothetical protein